MHAHSAPALPAHPVRRASVRACAHSLLWEEFGRALKDVKRDSMALLSEGDDGVGWLRVTPQSDLALVIERASLKLVERSETFDEEQLEVGGKEIICFVCVRTR